MIRGISRQIIEVQETGNVYYEKAYLIVKPEYASAERELLEKEARKVLKSMGVPSGIQCKKSFWMKLLLLSVAAVSGALIMALCIYLF